MGYENENTSVGMARYLLPAGYKVDPMTSDASLQLQQ